MAAPESLYVLGCAAQHAQPDGTCSVPVWLPYPQSVLPYLDVADGFLVSVAVISLWALGLKAKLVFRAARMGHW